MAEEEQVKAEYTAATQAATRIAGKEPRTAGKEPRRTIGKGMDDDDEDDEDEDDKESDTEDRKRNVKSGQGRGKDMGNHSDEDEEKEKKGMCIRVRPRFFDQVGHETMYAPSGNKHFFTKSFHRQTYQNYEQSRQIFGAILVLIKYLKNQNFQK